MSRHFSAFRKVFAFTFSSHTKTKGYRAATFVTAFLLFLIPFVSMLATEFFAGDNTQEETNYQTAAQTVYVFDEVEGDFDYSRLNDMSFFFPESGAVNPVYLHFSELTILLEMCYNKGKPKQFGKNWETGANPVRTRRCNGGVRPILPLESFWEGGRHEDPEARRPAHAVWLSPTRILDGCC